MFHGLEAFRSLLSSLLVLLLGGLQMRATFGRFLVSFLVYFAQSSEIRLSALTYRLFQSPLLKKYANYCTVVVGTILSVLGMFMASISTEYYQVFLAQGICCGIGNGCLFCPALSVTSTYFAKRKMLAVGICACGSATGGLIFTVMFQHLIPQIGYGWTMRVFGFFTLACLIICNILARPRVPPRKTGPLIELAAFKEPSYTLFAVGIFLTFWGVYFAFYYLSSFGVAIIKISQEESLTFTLILNGLGIIGRPVPAYLADRYTGPMNILIVVTLFSIICAFAMIGVTSISGLYAWTVVYGIVGNGLQGMFPATLSSLTTDLQKAGVRMGMIFVSSPSSQVAVGKSELHD